MSVFLSKIVKSRNARKWPWKAEIRVVPPRGYHGSQKWDIRENAKEMVCS